MKENYIILGIYELTRHFSGSNNYETSFALFCAYFWLGLNNQNQV